MVFEPFTPFMSNDLAQMLGLQKLSWDMAGDFSLLKPGTPIAKPHLLFEKIEDAAIEAQVERLRRNKEQNLINSWKPEPVKPTVSFEQFEGLDIRVGKVLECEKEPKTDKLLKFRIDDGMEDRTIISGIAKFYKPEDLVGKEVCFIANFEPRKMRGIVSEGMILSAVDADGRLVVIGPTGEVRPGSSVG